MKAKKELEKLLNKIDGDVNRLELVNDEQSQAILKKRYPEITVDDLSDILSQTILYDNANKCITFLGFLTAYTEQDQLNIYLSGPSSSGKTYLAKEISKYFPDEDQIKLDGSTPKAFFYREQVEDEETGTHYIDAERKIFLFFEMPHFQLMENLRSFLSHDNKNSLFLRTNKDNKSRNVAEEIYLRGFSSTIFCTTSMDMDEQEATRALLLSPEISHKKLEASIKLANLRNADPKKFDSEIESNPIRNKLKKRIVEIKDLHINSVILPDPEIILSAFTDITTGVKPRHTRDIVHLQSLIKGIALLNAWTRLDKNNNVIANENDVKQAIKLWKGISISQELGIPPYAYNFWTSFIIPTYESKNENITEISKFTGVTRQEIANKHFQLTGQMVNGEDMRKKLYPVLISAGLIRQEKDPLDHRNYLIYPIYPNNTVETDRG